MRREIIQFASATVLCTSGLTWAASDLVVTDIELIPALPAVTTGLLRATITNIGPDETGLPVLSQIGVEFYHDGVICDDATIAGDLNASESVTSETTACNPDIAGTYDITVIVDSDFDVSESNEANNDRIELFEWVETGPVVIFDTDFALPAMPDGDGAGTPVCIDEVSGLLVVGCDAAGDTTYSAGTGLDLSGTTFIADPSDYNSIPQRIATNGNGTPPTTTAWVTSYSDSITAPGVAGRVIAIAGTEFRVLSMGGTGATIRFGLTTSSTGTPADYARHYVQNEIGLTYQHSSSHAVFSVAANSTTTVYYRSYSEDTDDTWYVYRPRILLFFIPN